MCNKKFIWRDTFEGKREKSTNTNKIVEVTRETSTGRNTRFQDTHTGKEFTRVEFVERIEAGEYPSYYIRIQNGKKTSVSKPDGDKSNNLG